MNITNLTLQSYHARCQMRWIQILRGEKKVQKPPEVQFSPQELSTSDVMVYLLYIS